MKNPKLARFENLKSAAKLLTSSLAQEAVKLQAGIKPGTPVFKMKVRKKVLSTRITGVLGFDSWSVQ